MGKQGNVGYHTWECYFCFGRGEMSDGTFEYHVTGSCLETVKNAKEADDTHIEDLTKTDAERKDSHTKINVLPKCTEEL